MEIYFLILQENKQRIQKDNIKSLADLKNSAQIKIKLK